MSGCSLKINSEEAAWANWRKIRWRQHRTSAHGQGRRYFPVPPVDSLNDIRAAMCLALEDIGRHRGRSAPSRSGDSRAMRDRTKVQHRWCAAPTRPRQGTEICRALTSHQYGKTSDSCPNPSSATTVQSTHVHQSIWKGGKTLLPATVMPVNRKPRCITSAVSLLR